MKRINGFSKPVLIIGGFIIAGILFIPSVYFFNKYQSLKKSITNPPANLQEEVKDLVEKIGKLIELPKDEEPTLATVSDKNQLPSQAFFTNAQNGDKVLIYSKAKKAFLYRPSLNKLIEVGPVTISEVTPTPTNSLTLVPSRSASGSSQISEISIAPSMSQAQTASVAIYNGSKTAGLALKTEQSLKSKFNNLVIVQKSNSTGDYEKNIVIDLSGKQKKLASDVAAYLNAEISTLPTSETKPNTDILVIVAE